MNIMSLFRQADASLTYATSSFSFFTLWNGRWLSYQHLIGRGYSAEMGAC